MILGFDLDNVLIDKPPLIPHWFIERVYMKKTNGPLQYRIPSKKEQFIRTLSHASFLRHPLKQNLTFLKQITTSDNKLYLVSSRFGFLQKPTSKLIKKHKLDNVFEEMFFNYENKQPHIFKTEVIKKLKLEKYVDDDLRLLKFIAGRNNKVKLYWLNKKINKKLSPNITAITRLSDMLEK